jgi:hypothetical protein
MITAITLYLLSKEGSDGDDVNFVSIIIVMVAFAQDLKLLFM